MKYVSMGKLWLGRYSFMRRQTIKHWYGISDVALLFEEQKTSEYVYDINGGTDRKIPAWNAEKRTTIEERSHAAVQDKKQNRKKLSTVQKFRKRRDNINQGGLNCISEFLSDHLQNDLQRAISWHSVNNKKWKEKLLEFTGVLDRLRKVSTLTNI